MLFAGIRLRPTTGRRLYLSSSEARADAERAPDCKLRHAARFGITGLFARGQHLTQHSHTVVNKPNLALMMVPAHRNFLSRSPACWARRSSSTSKPADDLRRFNNWPARLHSKGFETTLRIPERQTSCHLTTVKTRPLAAPPRLTISD